jgi:hypothetical protein
MKQKLLILAALTTLAGSVHAQDVYGGLGLPGLVSLGYAQPINTNWGWRGEYSGGLSINKDGVQDGVNVTGTFKANHAGVFADWFPFDGGFRLVGGVTVNDIKANFVGVGSGTATINNKTVSMVGQTFNVNLTYPTTTPYLGLGYGHQSSDIKGLGFYADLGVMIGSFNTEVSTSLVNSGLVTQADVDAQTKTMRDSVSGLSVLPSFSVGLNYRF